MFYNINCPHCRKVQVHDTSTINGLINLKEQYLQQCESCLEYYLFSILSVNVAIAIPVTAGMRSDKNGKAAE